MKWTDISDALIANGLPLLGGAIAGPAGAKVGGMIAGVLGVKSTPKDIASGLKNPTSAIMAKLREIELKNEHELRTLTLQAEMVGVQQANISMRREVLSNDAYVRRMRPTFGYIVAFSLLLQVLVAIYAVLWNIDALAHLTTTFQALSMPQTAAMAVIGVYTKKRSDEKAMTMGVPVKGLLQTILEKR